MVSNTSYIIPTGTILAVKVLGWIFRAIFGVESFILLAEVMVVSCLLQKWWPKLSRRLRQLSVCELVLLTLIIIECFGVLGCIWGCIYGCGFGWLKWFFDWRFQFELFTQKHVLPLEATFLDWFLCTSQTFVVEEKPDLLQHSFEHGTWLREGGYLSSTVPTHPLRNASYLYLFGVGNAVFDHFGRFLPTQNKNLTH